MKKVPSVFPFNKISEIWPPLYSAVGPFALDSVPNLDNKIVSKHDAQPLLDVYPLLVSPLQLPQKLDISF